MLCRKVTYKLYPNERQREQLQAWTALHCELYNAALQERIEAYRKHGLSIGYYDQQNMLPDSRRRKITAQSQREPRLSGMSHMLTDDSVRSVLVGR